MEQEDQDLKLSPVEVKDGFIDRDALYAFFAQAMEYSTKRQIQTVSGGLLGRLVQISRPTHPRHVGLHIVCGMCGKPLADECRVNTQRHRSFFPNWPYRIDVESLKEHADEICAIPFTIGREGFRKDFNRLIDNL
jgi:hypothetical protein